MANIDPAFKLKQEAKFANFLEDPETPKLCPNEESKNFEIELNKDQNKSNKDEQLSSDSNFNIRINLDDNDDPINICDSSKSVSDISLKIKKAASSNNNSIQNEEMYLKEEGRQESNIISIPMNFNEEEQKENNDYDKNSKQKQSDVKQSNQGSDEDDLKFVFNLNLDEVSDK